MPYDVNAARQHYTDAEIADYLSKQNNFDASQARKAGYSDQELITHLTGVPLSSHEGMTHTPGPQTSSIPAAQDLVAGAAQGAGNIGATILQPIDYLFGQKQPGTLSQLINGMPPLTPNEQRRKDITDGLVSAGQSLGLPVNPNSGTFKTGKVGTEIAGTAGLPGAIVGRLRAAIPEMITAAGEYPTIAARVGNAIESAGMTTGAKGVSGIPMTLPERLGDIGIRTAGGGVAGATSAAAVNPQDALSGGFAGAITPATLRFAGTMMGLGSKAASLTAGELATMLKSEQQRGGQALAHALSIDPKDLPSVITKLQSAQTLVPGSTPTVAQTLQTPSASVLERVVASSPGGTALQNAAMAQAKARADALHGVAPVYPDGYATAQADTGDSISKYAQAKNAQSKTAVTGLYNSVDPNGELRLQLPIADMQSSLDKYLGPGTFGANTDAQAALRTAQGLSKAPAQKIGFMDRFNKVNPPASPDPRAATWDELSKLTSSINDAAKKAKDSGDNQAFAALSQMKEQVNSAVERAAGGNLLPGEVFPQSAADAWLSARQAHGERMQRFQTGPQAQIFQTRNGIPVAQGAQVAHGFWGSPLTLTQDVQSFKRLVDGNQALLGQFRSMVTTQGAQTANAGGELGQKFVNWVSTRLPGLREAFSPAEVQQLQGIASDIQRQSAAVSAGTAAAKGSPTYQNAASALDVGLIGSPLLSNIVKRVPFVGKAADAARETMAQASAKQQATTLANLLADPNAAASALQTQIPTTLGSAFSTAKKIPGAVGNAQVGGVTLADLLRQGAYRFPAVAASQ